ncbi:MAG: pyrimidine 5'-nucleotidase, partial [Pseudomonadota bacterium]
MSSDGSTADQFSHVTTWVFDLDNTLYPAECHLFHQIDARMTSFIAETLDLSAVAARRIQKDYYVRYGTTLSGLMKEHHIPPKDFMRYVHDIDLSGIHRDLALRDAIKALPGRRVIYTNGSQAHAENVAGKLGILDLFDDVFDVEMSDFTPKPQRPAYEIFWSKLGIDPQVAAMFEDM